MPSASSLWFRGALVGVDRGVWPGTEISGLVRYSPMLEIVRTIAAPQHLQNCQKLTQTV